MNAQQRHEFPAIVLIAKKNLLQPLSAYTTKFTGAFLRFTTLSQLSSRYCGLLSAEPIGSLYFLMRFL